MYGGASIQMKSLNVVETEDWSVRVGVHQNSGHGDIENQQNIV